MQTVRLGRTGLDVSAAGLGCGGHSRLGMARGKDVHHAADMVRRALDLGVTFIDTARAYGTEAAVGLGLKGRRDEAVVSTKAGIGRASGELVSAADMGRYVDESLAKLQTDHIDVFLLHGLRVPEYRHAVEVILPELARQKAAGKIRFIGASEQFGGDTGHALLQQALGGDDDPFDVVMVGFNIFNPSARRRVFPATQARDVGTLIMFAVREALSRPDELKKVVGELIGRGEVDPAKVDAADPLGFLKDAPGAPSVVEAAYRFCRHEPGADVVLTGTGDPEHLKANVDAILAPPLPPDVLARLEAIFGSVDSVSGN
ncbi:MAG TPA: aldo/keto reductase [Caulobacteraceae bacterium]|jgi:aryl-alcohol dehydrogenase-like predicted oxidoreductase